MKSQLKLSPEHYILLHYAWWVSSLLIMSLFSFEFGIYAFGLYSIYGPSAFLISLPFLLLAFVGPILELLYYKYLAYSIRSLTAMVFISFMMSIAVVFYFQLFTIYFLTPFLPIFFEGIMPLFGAEGLRTRIKIDFRVSLISISIVDLSIIGIEIVLLKLGLI